MIKKILRSTLAKKLAVFAVSFFVIGGLSAVTAFSPSREAGAVLHVPPFNITQSGFSFPGAAREAAAMQRPERTEQPSEAEVCDVDPAQAFVSDAMPAAPPLQPHVDTLGFFFLEQIPLSYDLQKYIYDRSVALGLEFELVLALIWRESTFRIEAVGVNRNGTRDSGLMQINDVNQGWLRERYGIYDLMDPFQNVDAGTMILADLLSRYHEPYALVAYQFGEAGMLRAVENGANVNELSRRIREKRDEYRIMRAQVFESLQFIA